MTEVSEEKGVEDTQVIVVGAGPIGLELALELKREGIPYIQFEAGQIGSTIEWYPLKTTFFSSPERIAIGGRVLQNETQTKASREEYLIYLRNIVRDEDLQVRTFERVVNIAQDLSGMFEVTTQRSFHGVGGPEEAGRTATTEREALPQSKARSRYVVLAIGDMHLPKLLNVPGEELPHVSHFFRDPHYYFGKKVFIVGGRNSAAEAAVRLYRLGAEVSMSYRGKDLSNGHIKPWVYPELARLIGNKLISFFPNSVVSRITLRSVTLSRTAEGEIEVPADFVLPLIGYRQDPTLFKVAGVALNGEELKPSFHEATMETNVKGLFVAGTCSAGSQLKGYSEFIETSHVHVTKIVAAIAGRSAPPPRERTPDYLLES